MINELDRLVHKSENYLRKKLFVSQYTNTEKVETFHVLHEKVALRMRGHSKLGTRNRHQRTFRKVGNTYVENDKFFKTLMNLRLDFLFTNLPQHFGRYLVVIAPKCFIN